MSIPPDQSMISQMSKDSGHGTDEIYSDDTLVNAILASNLELDQVGFLYTSFVHAFQFRHGILPW